MPISCTELKIFDRALQEIEFEWTPDCFYTIDLNSNVSCEIQYDLYYAMRIIVGMPILPITLEHVKSALESILMAYKAKRHILVWASDNASPTVIDGISFTQIGSSCFKLTPMLDRTLIMEEVLNSINKEEHYE